MRVIIHIAILLAGCAPKLKREPVPGEPPNIDSPKAIILPTTPLKLTLELFSPGDWETVDDYRYSDLPGSYSTAYGVTGDGEGNLYVVGYGIGGTGSGSDRHCLVKQSRDGRNTWELSDDWQLESGQLCEGLKIFISSKGDIFLIGFADNAEGNRFWFVRKKTKARNSAWQTIDTFRLTTAAGLALKQNSAHGITEDTFGNIFVVGTASDPYDTAQSMSPNSHWVVRKSANSGTTWTTVNVLKLGDKNSYAGCIISDTEGNLYSMGTVCSSLPSGFDVPGSCASSLIKGIDQGEKWSDVAEYQFSPGRDTTGADIFFDKVGNLFSTERGKDSSGPQPVGVNHWIVRKSTDQGKTFTVLDDFQLEEGSESEARGGLTDGLGNIYVFGTGNDASGNIHWVVRLSTDGGRSWNTIDDYQLVSGQLRGGVPQSMYEDHFRNLYVVGYGYAASTEEHWIIRKLSPFSKKDIQANHCHSIVLSTVKEGGAHKFLPSGQELSLRGEIEFFSDRNCTVPLKNISTPQEQKVLSTTLYINTQLTEEVQIWANLAANDATLKLSVDVPLENLPNFWKPLSTIDSPSNRTFHSAVWTGNRMIVFGGSVNNGLNRRVTNTGGIYEPVQDKWFSLNKSTAPRKRYSHSAVWTGNSMIVWGGHDNGITARGYLQDGGIYDPKTDRWKPVTTEGAPSPRYQHTSVWTGNSMIVWGGNFNSNSSNEVYNTGGVYLPAENRWVDTETSGAPPGSAVPQAVWTGQEMLVFGGIRMTNPPSANTYAPVNDGGRFNPNLGGIRRGAWSGMNQVDAPAPRYGHAMVWTGSKLIVWGGWGGSALESVALATGSVYDPQNDSWTVISPTLPNTPSARAEMLAVWTGTEMVIWGGRNKVGTTYTYYNDGARYNLSTNSWLPLPAERAPVGRRFANGSLGSHSVWTGQSLLFFGGFNGVTWFNDGAILRLH